MIRSRSKNILHAMIMCFVLTLSYVSNGYAGDSNPTQAQLNQVAPDFSLQDLNGKTHTLSQYKGKVVVLEWTNHTCPFVVRHYKAKTMTALAQKHKDVVWLTIDSTHFAKADVLKKWAQKEGVKTLLTDASGSVGKLYAARTTPHMFVINKEGKLVYMGAIDDDPYGDKKTPKNYVDQVLTQLKNGQKVTQGHQKAYGCSVKYKR